MFPIGIAAARRAVPARAAAHAGCAALAVAAAALMPLGILADLQWRLYAFGHTLNPTAPDPAQAVHAARDRRDPHGQLRVARRWSRGASSASSARPFCSASAHGSAAAPRHARASPAGRQATAVAAMVDGAHRVARRARRRPSARRPSRRGSTPRRAAARSRSRAACTRARS